MLDLHIFQQAILFLKMKELRDLCLRLALSDKGKKLVLIDRILVFLQTGEKKTQSPFPEASKARRGEKYPLDSSTRILKNSYKNDLLTRKFMKSLVGNHFHFTAYGIDWIEERWFAAQPPTYQEFADFWQNEYLRRQTLKVEPKKEWAYINFVQVYLNEHPNATKDEVFLAWDKERKKQLQIVLETISRLEDKS